MSTGRNVVTVAVPGRSGSVPITPWPYSSAMAGPTSTSSVASFVRTDLLGALAGVAFVVVANGLVVREPAVWLAVPPLVVLAGCLAAAGRALPEQVNAALALVAGGNWVVAITISSLFPFLWPTMVLTVLLPLVLATPFLERTALRWAIGAAAGVTAAVGAIGLLNDDGGVVVDIDDTFEFGLVIGALGALTIPFALVIRQNNALQRDAVEQLAASRRRVVEAADAERSRIERDLHDGAQQRLLALRMRLQLLTSGLDDPTATQRLDELSGEVDAAIAELRELAQGIHPPELAAHGLADALAAAVRRAPSRFVAEIAPVGRMDGRVERALYFTALEAMSNATKHTDGRVVVRVRRAGGVVELAVVDDGPGFDTGSVDGSVGLASMADRIDDVAGVLVVHSGDAGTAVTATVTVDAD